MRERTTPEQMIIITKISQHLPVTVEDLADACNEGTSEEKDQILDLLRANNYEYLKEKKAFCPPLRIES